MGCLRFPKSKMALTATASDLIEKFKFHYLAGRIPKVSVWVLAVLACSGLWLSITAHLLAPLWIAFLLVCFFYPNLGTLSCLLVASLASGQATQSSLGSDSSL
jgi:hypothetical protein